MIKKIGYTMGSLFAVTLLGCTLAVSCKSGPAESDASVVEVSSAVADSTVASDSVQVTSDAFTCEWDTGTKEASTDAADVASDGG